MSRSLSNVRYLPMTLESHSPSQVAPLLYESAPELFSLLFGSRALSVLSAFVERSHNRFSHHYICVAELEGKIMGAAVLVPSEQLHDQQDVPVVLTTWQMFRVSLIQRLILNSILQHDYPANTFYIGNLAVDAHFRSQGVGTQLLKRCFATAIAAGASSIYISVDIDNPRAQSLYESLGFSPIATKTLRLFGRTVGSVVLEKPLSHDFPDAGI